jgi:hypothetical protein
MGSAGHVVLSGMSRVQNVDALFFMLGCARCVIHKMHIGKHCTELVYCVQSDLQVT